MLFSSSVFFRTTPTTFLVLFFLLIHRFQHLSCGTGLANKTLYFFFLGSFVGLPFGGSGGYLVPLWSLVAAFFPFWLGEDAVASEVEVLG